MPQILGLALIGAGLIAGYKAIQSVAKRMSDELERAADEAKRRAQAAGEAVEKDLGKLEFDPKSGEYRVPRE